MSRSFTPKHWHTTRPVLTKPVGGWLVGSSSRRRISPMDWPPTSHSRSHSPLVMALAFTLLFVTLHIAAMGNEILRRRVRTLQMLQAQGA